MIFSFTEKCYLCNYADDYSFNATDEDIKDKVKGKVNYGLAYENYSESIPAKWNFICLGGNLET